MAKKTKTTVAAGTKKPVAGDNEKEFAKKMKVLGIAYNPTAQKKALCCTDISTSVDGMFTEWDKTYYVEVDSYNMVKPVFGQYILLNHTELVLEDCVFIVIHFETPYKPATTKKHFKLAQIKHGCTIKASVFHWNDMRGITTKKDFMELIRDNTL